MGREAFSHLQRQVLCLLLPWRAWALLGLLRARAGPRLVLHSALLRRRAVLAAFVEAAADLPFVLLGFALWLALPAAAAMYFEQREIAGWRMALLVLCPGAARCCWRTCSKTPNAKRRRADAWWHTTAVSLFLTSPRSCPPPW